MAFNDMIENQVVNQAMNSQKEKGLIDNLFTRDELAIGRALYSKGALEKADLPKMIDLAFGRELKLLNLDEKERYVLGKFATLWIVDIFKILEEMMEFKKTDQYKMLTPHAVKMFEECLQMGLRYIRSSLETYNYWARSSMSLRLKAFEEVLKNKFEVTHKEPEQQVEIQR